MASSIVLLFFVLSASTASLSAEYKVIFNQTGLAQYLKYDLDIMPISEFTFCIWVKFYNFQKAQSFFTYIEDGNKHIVRIWLDSDGQHLVVLFREIQLYKVVVNLGYNVWRHVCFTYQSDVGAWALYLDARLITCETTQTIEKFMVRGRGSIILGYGNSERGIPMGMEGEIFGAHLIAISTINVESLQSSKFTYTLNNLDVEENSKNKIRNVHLTPQLDLYNKQNKYNISINQHGYKQEPISGYIQVIGEKYITDSDKNKKFFEQSNSETQEHSILSEFETPPPLQTNKVEKHSYKIFEVPKSPVMSHLSLVKKPFVNSFFKKQMQNKPNEKEVPPSPEQDTNVYGQWTKLEFADYVLNYLKEMKFSHKKKPAPSTIPLTQFSDNYPYASNIHANVVQPNTNALKRDTEKNILEEHYMLSSAPTKNLNKFHIINERDLSEQERNVKILKEDPRSEIIESHAKIQPVYVTVTNRGQSREENKKVFTGYPNNEDLSKPKHHPYFIYSPNNTPFINKYDNVEDDTTNDNMYAQSLGGNEWHNIKTYHKHTPRPIPSINYINSKYKDPKYAKDYDQTPNILYKTNSYDEPITTNVSKQSNNGDADSKLNYKKNQFYDFFNTTNTMKSLKLTGQPSFRENFNHYVKLGNALNEKRLLGIDRDIWKQIFEGGHEIIPDIQRYRSDIDNEHHNVPSSLKPKVCKNLELLDNLFYLNADERIYKAQFLSPFKSINKAFQFIIQCYRICSFYDSPVEKQLPFLINWSKTPMRLYGGAVTKSIKDFCGHLKSIKD